MATVPAHGEIAISSSCAGPKSAKRQEIAFAPAKRGDCTTDGQHRFVVILPDFFVNGRGSGGGEKKDKNRKIFSPSARAAWTTDRVTETKSGVICPRLVVRRVVSSANDNVQLQSKNTN